MTKYTQSFKKHVVDFYLDNQQCLPLTYRHFNLPEKTVHRWVTKYQHYGIDGLAVSRTKKIYTPEQKLAVVQEVISGKYSAEKVTLKFALASSAMVSQWLHAYLKEGIKGLEPKPRGRSTMKPQYPKMPPKPTNRLEELELENLRLRAELAYLKKWQEYRQKIQKETKLKRTLSKNSD
ncbi:transposase [Bisgaardia hudsonensis]|uniref:Transposase n=1 Tax=Bisgaardia hudsonensis TaxID=109472 RepID=A0A4R2N003_9PAST|nr:hypothetical protein A6A11_06625 [Bisgaardia hudsonensis]TCP12343.1 transposase [Bisgaardia hudsonensis]